MLRFLKSNPSLSKNLKLQTIQLRSNHYNLFNLPQKFKIDEKTLKRNYLQLQRDYHPDKHGSNDQDFSAKVNTAYKTLKTPIERGLYLVTLYDESKTLESLPSPTDFEFLEKMMDLNDEAEDLTTGDEIDAFRNTVLRKGRLDLVDEIEAAFESDDLDLALEVLAQLKYFESINTRLLDKY
jgi:molecular chaperone HscB